MSIPSSERRKFLKAASYTVPVIMTLQAAPTFAKNGSIKQACNQGVGNGPEGCDPGNSNNNNPSNDELGGIPGNPGRSRR